MKRYRITLIILINIFSLYFNTPVFAKQSETFILGINRKAGSFYYVWSNLIYSEIFRRMNVDFQIIVYPPKRASKEANQGRLDGEAGRIYSYGNYFTNLLRVDESVFIMRVIAYSTNKNIKPLDDWSELLGNSYNIAYPLGVKIVEMNIENYDPSKLLSVIKAENGIEMLRRNRCDIYIDDENAILPLLNDNDKKQFFEVSILEVVPLYMYIHQKNKRMIPALNRTIKEIKKEGLIEQYKKEALRISKPL